MATMRWTDMEHITGVGSIAVDPFVDHVDGAWEAVFGDGTRKRFASLAVAVDALEGETIERTGHIYADDSVVGHCVFCGSGDVVGRSDDTVECQLCHRAFVVMEQPLYADTPAPDYQGMQIDGTGLEDPTADPVDEAPAFAPPPGADAEAEGDPAVPGQPKAEVPGTESPFEKKESSMLFRTAKGHQLGRDDFVRHVAITFTRAANTKG